MTISMIVAVAENGIIGNGGQMPWHISEDLKRFKRMTDGHPIVMGRKTFESIGRRPLPGRINVVVSRNAAYDVPEGVILVRSLNDALARFGDTNEEVFVIGGGEIYRQAMPLSDRLYLTRIAARPEGDTHFPEIDEKTWHATNREAHPAAGDGSAPAFEFVDYKRLL